MKEYKIINPDNNNHYFDYIRADELINNNDDIKPGDKIKINSKVFKIGIIRNHKILLAKSKYTVNYTALMFNDAMKGKMEGTPGLGTNADLNPYCEMYRNTEGAVCNGCYACGGLNQYIALYHLTMYNAYILTRFDIPAEYLPIYNNKNDIARFECFGDLYSVRQAKNYIRIAVINPKHIFTIMSKNIDILAAGFKALNINNPRADLPNMIKVESALMRNDINYIPSYTWIDHVFVVCEKDFASANGITFTCCDGETDRVCNECRRCYTRENMSTDFYIFELYR